MTVLRDVNCREQEWQSRRGFLKAVGGVGLVIASETLSSRPLYGLARGVPRLTPEQVKMRIRGPILTVSTPFTADFKVDYQGVRNMANLGLANGIDVHELTAGNSQYHALSYDEVKRLTKTLVEAVGGRGIVIAATGAWWTGQAVDYARYAESIGADALQVLVPPCSDDAYVAHFRKIAAATRLALVLQGDPKPALIQRLIEIPSVVSMKEDGGDDYYPDIVRQFGQRLAIFCGGQKRRYLLAQHLGSPAFFSFFASFAPEVTTRFWKAVQRGDTAAARDIVERYEKPVFDFCLAGPRPFHAYWHAFMEHFGVAQRYVRPPEQSCNEEDMQKVAAMCEKLGLAPSKRKPIKPEQPRERALKTLREALMDEPFKRMHAAEVMIWNGYKEEPKVVFEKMLAAKPPENIAAWRVLAQAEKEAGARQKYIEKVRQAALDKSNPHAEFAIESLAKLGYGGHDALFVELARDGTPVMQILTRWVLANSGTAKEEAYLTELLSLSEPRMRGVSAYALRFLKRLRPETLKRLRATAKKEPRDSEGRVFLLTTLYQHDPSADRSALKEELLRYAERGTAEERYQALLVVGKWAKESDLPRLEALYSAEDADIRIAAAHAVLTLLASERVKNS